MLNLGPHAGFIVAAYAVTFVGFAALILATVGDDRRQQQRLAELERQGIRRRSAPKTRTRAAKAPAAKKSPARKTATRKTATRKTAPKHPRAKKTPV